MKKSLIALAAALVAGGAFAQSSVTLYGVVDIGYGGKSWKDDTVGDSKTLGIQDGAIAGSRFGFRGTEDLGGGLKASFVIEQGFSPTSQQLTNQRTSTSGHQIDTNLNWSLTGRSSTSLNRQSFVALSGGFGEVRLGYQYTVGYEMSTLAGYNIGSEGVHGADTSRTYGLAAIGGGRANGISYISPKIAGGLTLRLQYGAGANQNEYGSDLEGYKDEKRFGVMAQWASGPLSVGVGYTQYKTDTEAGTAATPIFATADTSPTAKLTQIGASYDFGIARVAGTYNMGEDASDNDLKAWQVGVRVPFGAAAVLATYGQGNTENTAGTKISDHTQWQLGATYSLSKRTTAYVYYGVTEDDGTNTSAIDKKTNWIAGVIHTF
ncbi:porin [Azohydromonas sediminis]|uniref:porin n=1 Tax=Azohydromonas sediminis TaxID=2259674 RepID=UPI000E656842|nr:porin [Azohydromonas sediminis]